MYKNDHAATLLKPGSDPASAPSRPRRPVSMPKGGLGLRVDRDKTDVLCIPSREAGSKRHKTDLERLTF